MGASRGVEKVVALGSLSAEWREKVLADPIAAAREAGIELTDTELALLRTIPRATFEQMIDSFCSAVPRRSWLLKLGAGAAAAALIAAASAGCPPIATMGIRFDPPAPKSQPDKPSPPMPAGPPGSDPGAAPTAPAQPTSP